MISLIQLYNEIKVNQPGVTLDKVYKYIKDNELDLLEEYWRIFKKYNTNPNTVIKDVLPNLSKPELSRFYQEIQHIPKIQEIKINNPIITAKDVWEINKGLLELIRIDKYIQFWDGIWHYTDYNIITFLSKQSPATLNKIYNQIKQIRKNPEIDLNTFK